MTLKAVVLPAPFGPISPETIPLATSKETPSRATIPPKRSVTSRTERSTARSYARSGGGSTARAEPGTPVWNRLRKPRRARDRGADGPDEEQRPGGDEGRRHLARVFLPPDARAEPAVDLFDRVGALRVERLGPGVLGDGREGLAVGRHRDELLLPRRAGHDRPPVRAAGDGEDGE